MDVDDLTSRCTYRAPHCCPFRFSTSLPTRSAISQKNCGTGIISRFLVVLGSFPAVIGSRIAAAGNPSHNSWRSSIVLPLRLPPTRSSSRIPWCCIWPA